MIGEQVTCERDGCEVAFTKRTHNMKYCCDECCRLQTNAKIMEKYYQRRDQRRGKTRLCRVCNETKLSRYNDEQVCGACASRKLSISDNALIDLLGSVMW